MLCANSFPNKKEDSKVCRQLGSNSNNLGLINCSRKYFKILLTRNMQVLIYEWEGQTKNCGSFTASYRDEKKNVYLAPFKYRTSFYFVDLWSKEKILCMQSIEQPIKGMPLILDLYGEGAERSI
jgi:hypothetical protein